MNIRTFPRRLYICIYNAKNMQGIENIEKVIRTNLNGSIELVFNNMQGYDSSKDLLISDIKLENYCEDIGLGEGYWGSAKYVVYEAEDITTEYCERIFARKMHLPAFILETDNYVVREESEEDIENLYKLYDTLSDCEFIEPLYEEEKEREFVRNYIKNMYGFFDYGLWLVYDKKTGNLVGRMGIENRCIDGENVQELGYLVGKAYQHKGIAFEVCSAIKEYAKEYMGIQKLYCCIHIKNIPSIVLIQKLGFDIYARDIDGMNIYVCDL